MKLISSRENRSRLAPVLYTKQITEAVMAQINKKQAAALLKLSKHQMCDMVHDYRKLGWPKEVRKEGNVCYYLDYEILDWHKRVVEYKAKQKIKPAVVKLEGLDKRLVFEFITGKIGRPPVELTMAELANKHARRFGKTKTVHVPEVDIPFARESPYFMGGERNHFLSWVSL